MKASSTGRQACACAQLRHSGPGARRNASRLGGGAQNEVFLDVIESVNLLANSKGTVLHSEIVGAIKMRVFLSGMPEARVPATAAARRAGRSLMDARVAAAQLRLGLNDKLLLESSGRHTGKGKAVELEDTKFHQVRRSARG